MFFGDTIVNYGFSYAITKGEIPYNDFNLVLPLFSPFIYSIPLLFTKSIISIYLFQSLLLVFLFLILEKLLSKKVYLLFPLILLGYPIPLISCLFPGYNFILLFLIILLIYLEKINYNDYIIGIIIGLCIITKHTIGLFLFLPSLIYLKNYKKIGKRIIGILLPCFIFLIYLLLSNSLSNFINLCILGLFDFMKSNYYIKNYLILFIFILGLIYLLYSIIKNKKNINNYYVLVSILFVFPLIDDYHVSFFILLVLILILLNYKKRFTNKLLINYSIIFSILLTIIWTFIVFNYDNYKFISYNNYPLRYLNESDITSYNKINNYIKESNYNVILFGIGTENYFYKITNNLNITYFDLPNYGNYGYDSYNKMIEKFNSLENSIILINMNVFLDNYSGQYYKELAEYIINNYKEIDEVSRYKVYIKE
jgi:hypothetical protein